MKKDDSFQAAFNKDQNLNDSINKTEMKILENNTDNKFSANIDKLNESLYKINNYLKLKKDIDDLKRDSLAKNDIQRKLSLKSQWLNTPHGSTTSLNSLPNFEIKSSASESNDNVAAEKGKENIDTASNELCASTQSLAASPKVTGDRRKLANFKFASVQNLSSAAERRKRYLENKDELKFIHSLDISDKEIEALSREPEFEEKRSRFKASNEDLTEKMKNIELQSFTETMKNMQSHHTGPKVSTSSSQRDLSKYFPQKAEKTQTSATNLNQKELKDVDLSKYFALAPVQELKSLPSPSQSPNLPRKPISGEAKKPPPGIAKQVVLREAITKALAVPEISANTEPATTSSVEKKPKSDYDMFDQQLDGAVILRRRPKAKLIAHARSIEDLEVDISDERSPSREYSKLFDIENAADENIDDIFEKVAAKLIPELPGTSTDDKKRKSEESDSVQQPNTKKIKSRTKNVPAAAAKKPTKSTGMVVSKPLWCKQEIDDHARDSYLLSKLSSNLIDEIKMLEEQLLAGEQPKKSPRPTKATRRSKPIQKDVVFSDTGASDTELDNAIDNILNGDEVKNARQKGKKPSSKKTDVVDGTAAIAKMNKPANKGSNYDQPVAKPPRTKKKTTTQRNTEAQTNGDRKKEIITKPPRSRKELANEQPPMKLEEEKQESMVERPPRSRKNSTASQKFDEISESVVERPPRSRKNSVVEQPAPRIDEELRRLLVERPPRSRKNSLTDSSPPKSDENHAHVIERPPRSRKNSINDQFVTKTNENKIFADEPAIKMAINSHQHAAEPPEWNMNSVYEPKSPVKKFERDGGYDAVDREKCEKSIDVVDSVEPAQLRLNHGDARSPTPSVGPARKIPPPKPIRRNKSNSSIDRLQSEETNAVKRINSFNDRTSEPVRVATNGNHFMNNKNSHTNDVIKTVALKRERAADANKSVGVNLIGRSLDNIAVPTATDRNNEIPLLSPENQIKRGINIDQWSQRREDLCRHHGKPDNVSYRNDYKTGFIPADDRRNRQNNLSNYQDQIPPSNNLSALLDNITKPSDSVDSKRSNDYTTHKYPTRGIYDNISDELPAETTSDTSRRISNNYDYDNLNECDDVEPTRKKSLREGYLDNTERLLQRSRLIHNRKQEFMDEQISGNNPYLKRMIKRGSGEYSPASRIAERNYEEPVTNYRSAVGQSTSRLPKVSSISSLSKARGSNKSLNSISSTKRSVMDLFKKTPEKPKGKEGGCSVS